MMWKSYHLHHVRSLKLVAEFAVVMPCSYTGNYCYFGRAVFVLRDSFGLFHQHCSVALVLELVWVSGVDGDHGTVDVELSD